MAVINQRMAQRYGDEAGAVGRRIRIGQGEWLTVVGVVSDGRQRLNETPGNEVFRPLAQAARVGAGVSRPEIVEARLLVRTAVDPAVMTERLRSAVRRPTSHRQRP